MLATRLSYTVRFVCPAFLGNAEQSGQWRTPPFKALLRQWWRVAYAAEHEFSVDVNSMRNAEGKLFGAAADERNSNKSRVRLRLDRWDAGSLKTWQPLAKVNHPEIGRAVGSDLYLGYGPLNWDKDKRATILKTDTHKANAAIQTDESATFRIALTPDVSQQDSERIAKSIALIDHNGTLGGRSRNGWGSFVLEPLNGTSAPRSLDASMLRLWRDALALDWPHAIGRDEQGPLVWQTDPCTDWKAAMKRLAEIKIALRTQLFKFPAERPPHHRPLDRHWLSYPITKHVTSAWSNNARLPNSLRFKLRPDSRDPAKLRGVIFHVPCLPPSEFAPDRPAIERVWKRVHDFLDNRDQKLSRIAA
jgi:CRISPR-associated protein Cmr1